MHNIYTKSYGQIRRAHKYNYHVIFLGYGMWNMEKVMACGTLEKMHGGVIYN